MKSSTLRNQQGMALVVGLLILLVLTLIGVGSIGSTIMEAKLSGTERSESSAFYAAGGGAEVGFNQLPSVNLYSGTIGSEGRYRSGEMTASGPQPLKNLGSMSKGGYETVWEFKRFQVNSTGESSGIRREIELQVSVGPFPGGTQYNN